MLECVVYLQKVIKQFLQGEEQLQLFPTKKEWDQCILLLIILLPLKQTTDRLQQTLRPSIDLVFWPYKTLFNELDEINIIFELSKNLE